MEKVLRVRVKGTDLVDGEEIQTGGQVYRFIGNDEVSLATEQIIEDWVHFTNLKFSPYELRFKFERLDLAKEFNFTVSRDFLYDWPNEAKEKVIKAINAAVDI